MTKRFYDWEDTSDPLSVGYPDLGRYERLKTKKAVREDWNKYLQMFPSGGRKRTIRVWRISYEEVKV
jgi:hypothetical protein